MRSFLRGLDPGFGKMGRVHTALLALVCVVFACCVVDWLPSKASYGSGYSAFVHGANLSLREGLDGTQMSMLVDELVDMRVKTGDLDEDAKKDCRKEIIERSHKYYPEDILDSITEKAYESQLITMREESKSCNKVHAESGEGRLSGVKKSDSGSGGGGWLDIKNAAAGFP